MATVTKCDHCGNDDGTARAVMFRDGQPPVPEIVHDLCDVCVDKIMLMFVARVPRKRRAKKEGSDAV